MRRFLFFIAIPGLFVASCSKNVTPLSKQEMNIRIDSLIKSARAESDARARLDLERRMKIEVKVIVDSILNSHLRQAVADTPAGPRAGKPKIKSPNN